MRILGPIALQSAEVIDIAKFRAKGFQDLPITLLAIFAYLTFHEVADIGHHAIVVQEGIVDIKEKDNPRLIHVA